MNKNIGIFSITIAIGFLSTSCSLFKSRRPASENESVLGQIYNEVSLVNNSIDPLSCAKSYEALYQKLYNIAGTSPYFDTSDLKTLDKDIEASFKTRLALKESFKNFHVEDPEYQLCLARGLDIFRALRYVEDYLIEIRMDKTASAPNEYTSMEGEFPYFLINPKYANEIKSYRDLKSGDVILSRGNAYSSAAIAQIARNDYQFSHISFVYKDPESSELFTTEAHIEIGSVTAPIIENVNEKNVRSVIFRYKDADIANRASKSIFERVKKNQLTGKNIEYDFSMNYTDRSRLFCSEIVSEGFKNVLPNEDYLPKFKSQFGNGMIPFLNTIGVPVNVDNISKFTVFAPGDIQFDPDFELVAEWRNPKKLEETRFKDFILTKLFEKMEKEGYRIDPSLKMDVESRIYWLMRRMPIVKKFLDKKFALNMNPAQMEIFMALDKIGEAFYKYLELHAIDFDHPMTPKEIYTLIDDFIKQDREQYKKYKSGLDVAKPVFHLLFHP